MHDLFGGLWDFLYLSGMEFYTMNHMQQKWRNRKRRISENLREAEIEKSITNSRKIELIQTLGLNCMEENPLHVCDLRFDINRVYILWFVSSSQKDILGIFLWQKGSTCPFQLFYHWTNLYFYDRSDHHSLSLWSFSVWTLTWFHFQIKPYFLAGSQRRLPYSSPKFRLKVKNNTSLVL